MRYNNEDPTKAINAPIIRLCWIEGGGGSDGPKRPSNGSDGGRPPKNNNQGQMPPEIDDMLKKGQEQLRVLMGGGGKKGGRGSGASGDGGMGRNGFALILLFLAGLWA